MSDAAVDVDEHGFHLRVGQHDGQAVTHHRGGRATSDVEEVRRRDIRALLLAGVPDGVERAHDQSGAVADHADLTVEVHVVQPVFGCRRLERIGLHRIVEAGPPVVPERRIAVQRYLGVEGAQ